MKPICIKVEYGSLSTGICSEIEFAEHISWIFRARWWYFSGRADRPLPWSYSQNLSWCCSQLAWRTVVQSFNKDINKQQEATRNILSWPEQCALKSFDLKSLQTASFQYAHCTCLQPTFPYACTFMDNTSGKSVAYKRQTFKCKEEKQISWETVVSKLSSREEYTRQDSIKYVYLTTFFFP